MGTTRAEAPTRLLDLTRLVSRAGRAFTGIDRVEYAYLVHLLDAGPLWGLVRSSMGYLLLDPEGCAALKRQFTAGDWPAPDLLSRLRRLPPGRAEAETAVRRLAVARCLPRGLTRMLERHLPAWTHYLNTGHTNLTERVVRAVRARPASRIAVLLHDTIPLDYPDYTREGVTARFSAFLDRVGRHADLVICNSHQTEADFRRHMAGCDRWGEAAPQGDAPRTVVAHLGVEPSPPGDAPRGPWTGRAFFVVLGTIEPRKNHALLLDIWERDAPDAELLVCGARGWRNAEVFARLDRGIARVHELPGLDDGQVAALLRDSAGLLFPSLAEGYGLPPMEAAALGVPVLSADLPVLREVLGDIPVYAQVTDGYLWRRHITRMAEERRADPGRERSGAEGWCPPGWGMHFKTVLTLI
ncbi:MAG: glycosyltransferase family 1 protein [Rhodobacteraceae bacterium]|jgi:glycosyltransferase involved in cell wall biosynthesis|uniref:glycosyltransferase family 4 protein n=1 Tax=Salipiger TaxID=263377 RepID=UPI0008EBB5C0|nr:MULTISPECIES: glycosyltransferase family 1 protein [Salipiger]MAB06562.1 glycosyltransferase family 1 protein [Paracoccaceae bacterium]GGA26789.1 capsular polysaccharide glycosyltransferase biosynthesis protein [Salipiger profundus]SFD87043.1 Glycosyl transferases group 1 [Salipiger profundus]